MATARDQVYDVTPLLALHPGGDQILVDYGGLDATAAFELAFHSAAARRMMAEYLQWDPEEVTGEWITGGGGGVGAGLGG
jgi:cytochrome b involved in lipid metabolism